MFACLRAQASELAASEDAASSGKRQREDEVAEVRDAKRQHRDHKEHRSSKRKEDAAGDAATTKGLERNSGHKDREPKKTGESDRDKGREADRDRRDRGRDADSGRGRDADDKPREARPERSARDDGRSRERPRGDSRRREPPSPDRRRCYFCSQCHMYNLNHVNIYFLRVG